MQLKNDTEFKSRHKMSEYGAMAIDCCIVNPRHACTVRDTVVVLCVCVCPFSLFCLLTFVGVRELSAATVREMQ